MLQFKTRAAWSALLALASAGASADTFVVTYENAGVQSANLPALCAGAATCVIGTETFDTRPATGTSGGAAFTTSFGTGTTIGGSYAGTFGIHAPDSFGPAGGAGRYITTFSSTGYTISLTHSSDIPGVHYFGFWLGALDAGNQLQVLRGGTVVGTYSDNHTVGYRSTRSTPGTPIARIAVPEPESVLLVGLGLAGLAAMRRRR